MRVPKSGSHIRYISLTCHEGQQHSFDDVQKGQALAMGTYNAMFWRMTMGALIVAVLYLPTRPVPASGRVLKIHLIRAALTAVMAYLFFFGLTRVPLAQAIAGEGRIAVLDLGDPDDLPAALVGSAPPPPDRRMPPIGNPPPLRCRVLVQSPAGAFWVSTSSYGRICQTHA